MSELATICFVFAGLMGAVLGSFLTVVVARVPAMVLANPRGRVSALHLLRGLSWPGSHCGECAAPVRAYDNIPLLSFLMLRGRCRSCSASIGTQYFALEVGTAGAAILCTYIFGWSLQAAMVFGFLATLLALCMIDLAELLLPDVLVLPLLPLGIAYQGMYGAGLLDGLGACLMAGSVFWAIGEIFRRTRGVEGLGGGDIKLAAAVAAWVGIAATPLLMFASFATGLIGMGIPILIGRQSAATPVPFGPFIALCAMVLVLDQSLAMRVLGLLV